MKKIVINLLLSFVLAIFLAKPVLAQNIKEVKLPLFVSGNYELNEGNTPISRDLIMIGEKVKITGDVDGDVYLAGGDIEITGNISGNLIVLAKSLTIKGKISKNLITLGMDTVITEEGEIEGYVLSGNFSSILNGKMNGPVKIFTQNLKIDPKAMLLSDLEASVITNEISTEAKIEGEKKITVRIAESKEERLAKITKKTRENFIWSYLSSIILLFFFVKFFGDKIKGQEVKAKLGLIMKKGLIVLIATPFISLALLLTMLGIPSAILIFIIYLATLFVSEIVASLAIGKYLAEKYQFKANLFIHASLILLVIRLIQSATFLNFFGGIFQLLVMAFGVGIVYLAGKNLIAKR
jgi:cytoskeletal protein CcmA (bactofilin family)